MSLNNFSQGWSAYTSDFWCEENSNENQIPSNNNNNNNNYNNKSTTNNNDFDYFFDDTTFSVETEEDLPDDFFLENAPPPNQNTIPRTYPYWPKFCDFSSSSSQPSPSSQTTTKNGSVIIPQDSVIPPDTDPTYDPLTEPNTPIIEGSYGNPIFTDESDSYTAFSQSSDGEFTYPDFIKTESYVPGVDYFSPVEIPSPPTAGTGNETGTAVGNPPVIPLVTIKPDPLPNLVTIKSDPFEKDDPYYQESNPCEKIEQKLESDPFGLDHDTDVEENTKLKKKPKKQSFPRKHFRETIGTEIYKDLMSEQYSYDEIITKYSKLYPEHAARFTPSFCSKVRCGRIMNVEPNKNKGVCKSRVKRVSKLSQRKMWRKMTPELFEEISSWENNQNRQVKQSELEQIFNVNRSTYYRWKKLQSRNSVAQRESKTFGN